MVYLNVNGKIFKLLEENKGEYLYDLEEEKHFLSSIQNVLPV